MKAEVNHDLCIGCTLCTSICPEIFYMNDEDKAETLKPEVPKSLEKSAVSAMQSCPVEAITVK